jgi:hypothetical protein
MATASVSASMGTGHSQLYLGLAEDVLKVTLHMAEQLRAESGVARVLVARDLFCLCVMWRCVSRGVTAVEWRLSDIQLLDGTLPHNARYPMTLNLGA